MQRCWKDFRGHNKHSSVCNWGDWLSCISVERFFSVDSVLVPSWGIPRLREMILRCQGLHSCVILRGRLTPGERCENKWFRMPWVDSWKIKGKTDLPEIVQRVVIMQETLSRRWSKKKGYLKWRINQHRKHKSCISSHHNVVTFSLYSLSSFCEIVQDLDLLQNSRLASSTCWRLHLNRVLIVEHIQNVWAKSIVHGLELLKRQFIHGQRFILCKSNHSSRNVVSLSEWQA